VVNRYVFFGSWLPILGPIPGANPENQYAGVGEVVLCARSQGLGEISPRPYGTRGGWWAAVPGRRPRVARTCPGQFSFGPYGAVPQIRCGDGIGNSRSAVGRGVEVVEVLPTQAELGWGTGRSLAEICGFPPCRQKKGDRMGHGAGLVKPAIEKQVLPLPLRCTQGQGQNDKVVVELAMQQADSLRE
jgi:hypothetical protein